GRGDSSGCEVLGLNPMESLPPGACPTGVPEVRNEFWSLHQRFTAQFSADLKTPFRARVVFLLPDRSSRDRQSTKGADRCDTEPFSFHVATVAAGQLGRSQFLTRPPANRLTQTRENRFALVGPP